MSAKHHPPLLAPAQAQTLLDQVVYEQVMECIDLDALYRFEHSLSLMVSEVEGVSADHVEEVAAAMVDRALHRLPGDVRIYLRAARWATGDCELCDEEARPPDPSSPPPPLDPLSPPPPSRARVKS